MAQTTVTVVWALFVVLLVLVIISKSTYVYIPIIGLETQLHLEPTLAVTPPLLLLRPFFSCYLGLETHLESSFVVLASCCCCPRLGFVFVIVAHLMP